MFTRVEKGKVRWESRLAVNARDGTVWVPPGEFEMGDGQKEAWKNECDCPKHRVWLDGYWIGVYCVTNGQYGRFVAETKRSVEGGGWKVDAGKVSHPVVNVNWDDCAAYAVWAGLSLPTEAQWEKAARGPLGLIYPWGNEWDGKRCRNDKNKGSEQTAGVGKYAAGVSGYGTYQQSGNVWEWCADWYGEKYYTERGAARNPTGPGTGAYRVRRGGCWWYGVASYFRGAYRSYDVPASRAGHEGFRLVRMAS